MVQLDVDAASDRELAVGVAFLVPRPIATVLEGFRTAVNLSADHQLLRATVLNDRSDSFVGLALWPNGAAEAKRYLTARPGNELNLSVDEMRAFQNPQFSNNGSISKVERELQHVLLNRYRAYVARGLDGVEGYARSGGTRNPSDELRLASQSAAVSPYAPTL